MIVVTRVGLTSGTRNNEKKLNRHSISNLLSGVLPQEINMGMGILTTWFVIFPTLGCHEEPMVRWPC